MVENWFERDFGFLNRRGVSLDIYFRKINLEDGLVLGWDWGLVDN